MITKENPNIDNELRLMNGQKKNLTNSSLQDIYVDLDVHRACMCEKR